MILSQHYLACLSHASYLIGDETSGRAVVVDPRRDIDVYLDEANEAGLTIERVIETHLHADFLSGHLELAARTGAVISYGTGAQTEFHIEHLKDGQRLSLGEVTLEVLATPGHTPESICVAVYEHPDDDTPHAVLTGDTLFVGDVGRPDLLASSGDVSAESLARSLYRSLHGKILGLPDSARVFPAHGAGSSCGRNLSTETSSTMAEQRRTNYALAPMAEDEFVALVTEGQPPRPQYFEYDARRNRELRALLDEHTPPELLALDDVLARQRAGALLLDGREPADFAGGHLAGAVNVGLQGRFAEWAADVLDPIRDIVLVGDPDTALPAKIRLGRVGYDRVVGRLADLADVLISRPDLCEASSRLSSEQLAERMESSPVQLIDVRSQGEAAAGRIPGGRPIPLAVLAERLDGLDRSAPTAVYCASGYRSIIAASVMRRAGFEDVSDLLGGFGAWDNAGLPVDHDDPVAAVDPEEAYQQALARGLLVHRKHPLNCETSVPALIGGVVMPNAHFYVRNHFQIPKLDGATWRLPVGGLVDRPLQLSFRDLTAMRSETRVVTLECAGNGRSQLDPPVDGEQWRLGAVSTAEWTGTPLVEVLDRAGLQPAAVELLFRGSDSGSVDGAGTIAFERSLPVDAARDRHVLLAYAMNGEPLPHRHGYPVRLVVPGWYGVASVKWLAGVEAIAERFDGYFQEDKYWYEFERDGTVVRQPVTLQRVRALITEPAADETVACGDVTVRGVAWSGAAPIARVEVSVDGGPWQEARLVGDRVPHRWQWFELITRLERPGLVSLRARATDLADRRQPDEPEWNRFGYGNNAVADHPVRLV